MTNAFDTASISGGIAVLKVEINSDYDLEKLVVRGLPYQTVDKLVERIYPRDKTLRQRIIPSSTYYRRRKAGYLTSKESSKVERIALGLRSDAGDLGR